MHCPNMWVARRELLVNVVDTDSLWLLPCEQEITTPKLL